VPVLCPHAIYTAWLQISRRARLVLTILVRNLNAALTMRKSIFCTNRRQSSETQPMEHMGKSGYSLPWQMWILRVPSCQLTPIPLVHEIAFEKCDPRKSISNKSACSVTHILGLRRNGLSMPPCLQFTKGCWLHCTTTCFKIVKEIARASETSLAFKASQV